MQINCDKNSSIIERILRIIDFKGITKYKFCMDMGFSKGFLDKPREISTDKYANILVYFPDISPEWLLTGRGDMFKKKLSSISQDVTGKYNKQFANSSNIISDIKEVGYENENELVELKRENILLQKQLSEKDTLIKTLIEQQQQLINKLK